MKTPDSFMLICDGSSGDVAAEVRMAAYLAELFTGWKSARSHSHEPWEVSSSRGGTWRWGPDGRLTVGEPRNRPDPPPPPTLP